MGLYSWVGCTLHKGTQPTLCIFDLLGLRTPRGTPTYQSYPKHTWWCHLRCGCYSWTIVPAPEDTHNPVMRAHGKLLLRTPQKSQSLSFLTKDYPPPSSGPVKHPDPINIFLGPHHSCRFPPWPGYTTTTLGRSRKQGGRPGGDPSQGC